MSAACRALGDLLTSTVGRQRPPTSRSCRDSSMCRVLNCEVFLVEVGRTELRKLCSAREAFLCRFSGRFEVLEVFLACSHREDVAQSGGNTGELGPESLKVLGMGLQLCGLYVWCWLASTVLWLYCVVVERQLDLSSMTWYLVVVGTCALRGKLCVVVCRVPTSSSVEMDLCSMELMPVLSPFVGRFPVKLVASGTSCCNDLPVRHVA
ncbi:hypothetical protein Taro_021954 [Colocasia esculenta]|uniref:Uncharacterized protein n=1 Tax=Colocasia esculenta TaxID=4460 RepID=A0A843UT04_COLES|nr:hypothetical protein [Colocasia esculenta]